MCPAVLLSVSNFARVFWCGYQRVLLRSESQKVPLVELQSLTTRAKASSEVCQTRASHFHAAPYFALDGLFGSYSTPSLRIPQAALRTTIKSLCPLSSLTRLSLTSMRAYHAPAASRWKIVSHNACISPREDSAVQAGEPRAMVAARRICFVFTG